jgi:hypothetical protein
MHQSWDTQLELGSSICNDLITIIIKFIDQRPHCYYCLTQCDNKRGLGTWSFAPNVIKNIYASTCILKIDKQNLTF